MAEQLLGVAMTAAPASKGICHTRQRLDLVIRTGAFVKAAEEVVEKVCQESQLLATADRGLRAAAIDVKWLTSRERA